MSTVKAVLYPTGLPRQYSCLYCNSQRPMLGECSLQYSGAFVLLCCESGWFVDYCVCCIVSLSSILV